MLYAYKLTIIKYLGTDWYYNKPNYINTLLVLSVKCFFTGPDEEVSGLKHEGAVS